MKPITFKEKNVTLQRPVGTTEKECAPLDVYRDGRTCLSCWRASWKERLSILIFGNVWIWVWSGITQPPVSLLGAKTAFVYPTLWGKVKALMLRPVRLYREIPEGGIYKLGLLKQTIPPSTYAKRWAWYWILVVPYWYSRMRREFTCRAIRLWKYDGKISIESGRAWVTKGGRR